MSENILKNSNVVKLGDGKSRWQAVRLTFRVIGRKLHYLEERGWTTEISFSNSLHVLREMCVNSTFMLGLLSFLVFLLLNGKLPRSDEPPSWLKIWETVADPLHSVGRGSEWSVRSPTGPGTGQTKRHGDTRYLPELKRTVRVSLLRRKGGTRRRETCVFGTGIRMTSEVECTTKMNDPTSRCCRCPGWRSISVLLNSPLLYKTCEWGVSLRSRICPSPVSVRPLLI